jgi:hypothetical protein
MAAAAAARLPSSMLEFDIYDIKMRERAVSARTMKCEKPGANFVGPELSRALQKSFY